MKSGYSNNRSNHAKISHCVAACVAASLLLLAPTGCNKEVPKPELEEAAPEANLVVIKKDAAPVEIVVKDSAPVIDHDCQVSILGYHDFTETGSPTAMRIRAGKFREQMQAIKDANIPVISLSDYMAWRRDEKQIPKRCMVITADDGWREFHTYALPVLKEFEFPFTVYIYTAFLNNGGRSLSDEQVRELIAANGEIGSHSISHKLMTSKRGFASDEEYEAWILKEMKESKEILEQRFGVKVTSFAYPFGGYNEHIIELMETVGYDTGVTVNGVRAHFDVKLAEVPRYIIHGNNDTNWNMATNFRGSGGLAKANNLLQATVDEEGVEQPVVVKLWPDAGEVIKERMPEIQVDLSQLEGVIVESIHMRVDGFGKVPAEYDEDTKVLRWKVPRKLRMEAVSVSVEFRRIGENLPDLINWEFKIDRTGLYIDDQKKDEKKSDDKVALAGLPETVEVRRALTVE